METLAAIEHFVRSAESKSFSAAARQLGVTPAAVSKSVAKLEQSLGVQLFRRTTRSVSLTEPGELLLREAAGSLAMLQAAMARVSSETRAPCGALRVSLAPTFGRDYVLPMLGAFLEKHPGIVPDWDFGNRQVDLAADGFDAAIGGAIELADGVTKRELAPAHIVAVASPAWVDRNGLPKTPADLAGRDGIWLRSPQSGRVRAWSFQNTEGEEATLETRQRIIFTDTEALGTAALAGLGVATLPMPHAVRHLESGALVRLLPRWHANAGAISLYFGSQKLLPSKTRVFIDFVVAHFKAERLAERFRAA
jgi:DNA-binding transcriptional LysR family regulator